MNRARRPPLQHPLAPVFDRAVDSLGVALSPDTTRHYRGTAQFPELSRRDHPEVQRLDQLRREHPHPRLDLPPALAMPPLLTASYINLLVALRGICNELAWTEQLPELAHLIRREDIRASRTDFRVRSQQSRINSCKRSSSAATIWWQCLSVIRHTGHAHR